MTKISNKLRQLRQRVVDLESKIALQDQQAAFLGQHGRVPRSSDVPVIEMQKRLASLKRSCEILASNLSRATGIFDSARTGVRISRGLSS